MKKLKTAFLTLTLVMLCFSASSCIFFSVRPERVDKTVKTTYVWSASKVHLNDGSVVCFTRGFTISKGLVKGQESGFRYDLLRNKVCRVQSVPLDSVAYMQAYRDHLLGGRFVSGSLATLVYFFSFVVLWAASMPDTRY